MNSIQSYTDYSNFIQIINSCYKIYIDQIDLHREMIGYVYFAQSCFKKYVLKLYRSFDTDNALRSIRIMQYLKINGFPVVSMVPTIFGDLHIAIDTHHGQSTAVLYEYIEGTEPVLKIEIERIGQQVGWMHWLMKRFPEPIFSRGKEFYIDRFISILQEKNYPSSRIDELEAYGQELWRHMEYLPDGFCHGDLHSGNMRQTQANQYVFFDFDAASHSTSVIDAATLSDNTDFNHFNESSYDGSLRLFERFYEGYSKKNTLNDVEVAAVFDFIAIRHYELIATITKCQGLEDLSYAFLDEQYDWLLRWKNLCERKRRFLGAISAL